MRARSAWLRLAATGLCACLAPSAALAVDWEIETSTNQLTEVDDNFRLEEDSSGVVFGTTTNVELGIFARSPTSLWRFTPGFQATAFAGPGDTEGLNDITPRVSTEYTREGPRTTQSLDFSFTSDSTSFTEIEDTGITTGDATRTQFNLNGDFTYLLGPSGSSLGLSGFAVVNQFSDGASSLTPTTNVGASVDLSHVVNPRLTTGLSLGVTQFTADSDEDTESLTYSLDASADYDFNSRWSFGVGLGALVTDTERFVTVANGRRRDTEVSPGFNANAEINYRRETTEFALTASQALEPSSLGELQTRINFGFSASRQINERSTLRFDASYSTQTSSGTFEENETDRVLFSVSPGYSYQLTRNWSADLTYRYRRQGGSTSGDSSNFSIRLTHNHTWLP